MTYDNAGSIGGETPADFLRLTFEQVARQTLDITDGRDFAIQYPITFPAQEAGRRIQPVMGINTAASPSGYLMWLSGEVLLARQTPGPGQQSKLLAALGNITLENKRQPVTMPAAQQVNYFPAGFRALGPYEAFVVTAAGDDVRLQAKAVGGKWWDLGTDGQRLNPEKDNQPAIYLGDTIATLAIGKPASQINLAPRAPQLPLYKDIFDL